MATDAEIAALARAYAEAVENDKAHKEASANLVWQAYKALMAALQEEPHR